MELTYSLKLGKRPRYIDDSKYTSIPPSEYDVDVWAEIIERIRRQPIRKPVVPRKKQPVYIPSDIPLPLVIIQNEKNERREEPDTTSDNGAKLPNGKTSVLEID